MREKSRLFPLADLATGSVDQAPTILTKAKHVHIAAAVCERASAGAGKGGVQNRLKHCDVYAMICSEVLGQD